LGERDPDDLTAARFRILDETARRNRFGPKRHPLATLRRASPLPRPPAGAAPLTVVIPFHFDLR